MVTARGTSADRKKKAAICIEKMGGEGRNEGYLVN